MTGAGGEEERGRGGGCREETDVAIRSARRSISDALMPSARLECSSSAIPEGPPSDAIASNERDAKSSNKSVGLMPQRPLACGTITRDKALFGLAGGGELGAGGNKNGAECSEIIAAPGMGADGESISIV